MYKRYYSSTVSICLVVHAFSLSGGAAETPYSPATLALQQSLRSMRNTDWISYDGLVTTHGSSPSGPASLTRTIRFKRRGDHFEITSSLNNRELAHSLSKRSRQPHRFVNNSTTFARYSLNDEGAAAKDSFSLAEVSRNEHIWRVLNEPDAFGPVDGYLLCPNGKRFVEVILDDGETLDEGEEKQGTFLCRKISSKTPCGTFTLWLDESNGSLPRQLSITRGPSDIGSGGTKLSETPAGPDGVTLQKEEGVLSDVEIDNKEDHFIITKARYKYSVVNSKGTVAQQEILFFRENIELKPEISDQNSFHIGFVDGSIVNNLDDPTSGVSYQIKGGKMIPTGGDYEPYDKPILLTKQRSLTLLYVWFISGVFAVMIACRLYILRRRSS